MPYLYYLYLLHLTITVFKDVYSKLYKSYYTKNPNNIFFKHLLKN